MKSNCRIIALATLIAIASLSQTLHAQTSAINVRVDVPFSFDYGKAHFSHGTYIMTMTTPNVLTIRTYGQSAMVMAQLDFDARPAKASQVTFRKYGDRYFLEEVSIVGAGAHVSVLESREEKRAARELASRGAEATEVALALLPLLARGN